MITNIYICIFYSFYYPLFCYCKWQEYKTVNVSHRFDSYIFCGNITQYLEIYCKTYYARFFHCHSVYWEKDFSILSETDKTDIWIKNETTLLNNRVSYRLCINIFVSSFYHWWYFVLCLYLCWFVCRYVKTFSLKLTF